MVGGDPTPMVFHSSQFAGDIGGEATDIMHLEAK